MTDEERLAEIENSQASSPIRQYANIEWLVARVRALAAERDALIVERDA